MKNKNTTAELGMYKENISKALFQNADIRELILGDTSGMSASQMRDAFKEHIKSHLFIDDTITETDSFIFYDVRCPYLDTNVKGCQVIMYVICHRDILDNYIKDGYYGNRADILTQMVEDTLVNDEEVANSFGIGKLTLDSIDIYNATRFYGRTITLNVPTFR